LLRAYTFMPSTMSEPAYADADGKVVASYELLTAVYNCDAEQVARLLPITYARDIVPIRYCMPVHMAVARGWRQGVEMLSAHGFSLDGMDALGYQPIFVAMFLGKTHMVEWLLQLDPRRAHARNLLLETPLHFALRAWQDDCVKLLVSSGADVNAVDATGECVAITAALSWSMHEALSLLLDWGACYKAEGPDAGRIDVPIELASNPATALVAATFGARLTTSRQTKTNPRLRDIFEHANFIRRGPLVQVCGV
jgi:hypothetical protein